MQNPLHDAFAKHIKILLAIKHLRSDNASRFPESTAPGVSFNVNWKWGTKTVPLSIPKRTWRAGDGRAINARDRG